MHEHGLPVGHHHQALHLRSFGQMGERRDFGDGLAAGRVKLFGRRSPSGSGIDGADRMRNGLFQIGRIAADWAVHNEVFARVGSAP